MHFHRVRENWQTASSSVTPIQASPWTINLCRTALESWIMGLSWPSTVSCNTGWLTELYSKLLPQKLVANSILSATNETVTLKEEGILRRNIAWSCITCTTIRNRMVPNELKNFTWIQSLIEVVLETSLRQICPWILVMISDEQL